MIPKPYVFTVVLARFGLAVAQWIATWAASFIRNERKNTGYWKHAQQHSRKNWGFCIGKPRILVAETNAHIIFWVISLPEGPPGVSPS